MSGRYYVSPSTLYSVVRAHPGPGAGARGQVFDVPVVGDWVTIAVVAERSPVRISRAPVAVGPGEARDADDTEPTPAATPSVPSTTRNSKLRNKDPPPRAGRKYVNLMLIDFGAGGKKGTARGDAALSLLLFESDAYDTVSRGDGLLPEKIYKGGSRGAYESMAKLREGSVIALLNPRVLKPLQKPGAPSMLALTPESADSVAVIGTARDLGMCGVVKRDGKPCGSWCDKRVSEVCEYHVQHAIEQRRASRPEFSAGTSGMSMGANSQKRKAAYDPQRKWGLAPPDGRGSAQSSSEVADGATYVVAGHIVASGKRDLFVNESVGREAQARAARRASSRDTDLALKRLLSRDKEGMEAVQAARSFVRKKKAVAGQVAGGKSVPKLGEDELELLSRKKRKEEEDSGDGMSESESGIDDDDDSEEEREETRTTTRNAYSAQVIKELGFDPTLRSSSSRAGRRRKEKDDPQNTYYSELAELASCREIDKISLGPRPGGHLRSVVSAPPKAKEREREVEVPGKPVMVDLDESSDDELTVEPPAH
ncbi:hypothetical protein BC827DRAFT_1240840 [Russula dissimulans]|nr:hypothetical protein BC827DRAFT_1240840 [Russula dissimulans]